MPNSRVRKRKLLNCLSVQMPFASALIIVALAIATPAVQAQAILDTALSPPASELPTEVYIELWGVEVVSIDEAGETFELEAHIFADWLDPRLADSFGTEAIYQGATAEEVLKSEIWWPYFELVDEREPREILYRSVQVSPGGYVAYNERFHAVIKQPMLLPEFPFDSHTISFSISPFALPGTAVQFIGCSSGGEVDEIDEIACRDVVDWEPLEWIVLDSGVSIDKPETEDGFASATVFINIERVGQGYISNIVFPLILIVFISSAVFWMNLDRIHLGERLGVSFTSVLTVVAFDFVASDTLPNLWYATRLDSILTLGYLFLTLNIVENIAVSRLHERGNLKTATLLDGAFRWAYPPAFLIAIIIALYRQIPPLD